MTWWCAPEDHLPSLTFCSHNLMVNQTINFFVNTNFMHMDS
jgi:hypothetical protein